MLTFTNSRRLLLSYSLKFASLLNAIFIIISWLYSNLSKITVETLNKASIARIFGVLSTLSIQLNRTCGIQIWSVVTFEWILIEFTNLILILIVSQYLFLIIIIILIIYWLYIILCKIILINHNLKIVYFFLTYQL